MRTRPRKPTALRVLEGNPSRRPLPENEPQPIRKGPPTPPDWLTPAARALWDDVIAEAAQMGLVTPVDWPLAAAFCESWARWRAAEDAIAETAAVDTVGRGLLMKMPSGAIVQSPLIGVARRAKMDALRFASELGLSPSARAGLSAEPPPADDDILRKYGLVERRRA